MQALSDEELLVQARSGDRIAFQRLVERYERLVAATVIGMLGRGPEAEDVGQETFIRFYKSMHRFRGDARLSTYLTRIAINLSLNEIKRRKRKSWRFVSRDREDYHIPEPAVEGGGELTRKEVQFRVQQAIETLDPKFRAVVVLRLINGYSTQETADLLNIPLGTVLSRLYRAQIKLKDLLSPYIHDHEET